MTTLKLTQVGNSVGLILPKEILAKLNLGKGDTVYLTEVADGGMKLSPYDEDFGQQMDAARLIMKKRRGVLRELAK